MNICQGCKKNGKTLIKKMDAAHIMFGHQITVKDVPVQVCEECGYIEYIYPRELDFLLRDAYRNRVYTLPFTLENK